MQSNNLPKIGPSQYRILEQLCNACGVSGDEGKVREIVLDHVKPYADTVKVDALGNVLATKNGKGRNRIRVMIAAHMDEVGFMITNHDGDGQFRFDMIGGIDIRHLPGKSVWIGEKNIPGVIGAKPIHLTTKKERSDVLKLGSLRIDVGPENKEKIKIGDRSTFATRWRRVGPSIRAKALDDRLGVATLIQLLTRPPDNIDLLAAFTVQEEVGLRGAHVAAYTLSPDLAFVIDSTPANDLPSYDREENLLYNTRLDAGPAIYIADRGTLSDPRLIRHLVKTAETQSIPYQIRQPGGGGTDAAAIHLQRGGVPSVSVSVPSRYLHTAAGIARVVDWKNTLALMYFALGTLSNVILTEDR